MASKGGPATGSSTSSGTGSGLRPVFRLLDDARLASFRVLTRTPSTSSAEKKTGALTRTPSLRSAEREGRGAPGFDLESPAPEETEEGVGLGGVDMDASPSQGQGPPSRFVYELCWAVVCLFLPPTSHTISLMPVVVHHGCAFPLPPTACSMPGAVLSPFLTPTSHAPPSEAGVNRAQRFYLRVCDSVLPVLLASRGVFFACAQASGALPPASVEKAIKSAPLAGLPEAERESLFADTVAQLGQEIQSGTPERQSLVALVSRPPPHPSSPLPHARLVGPFPRLPYPRDHFFLPVVPLQRHPTSIKKPAAPSSWCTLGARLLPSPVPLGHMSDRPSSWYALGARASLLLHFSHR